MGNAVGNTPLQILSALPCSMPRRCQSNREPWWEIVNFQGGRAETLNPYSMSIGQRGRGSSSEVWRICFAASSCGLSPFALCSTWNGE